MRVSATSLPSVTKGCLEYAIYEKGKKLKDVKLRVSLHSASAKSVTYGLEEAIPEYVLRIFFGLELRIIS